MIDLDDLPAIFAALEASPGLLRHLIAEAPPERLKVRRIAGKWSIHEHACHLASIHPLMMKRLKLFQEEASPEIRPYVPDAGEADTHLINEDLDEALERFASGRRAFVSLGRTLSPEVLRRKARHPEYDIYTPFHMFRHILMHDHVHFYRIEELALTRDDYLSRP